MEIKLTSNKGLTKVFDVVVTSQDILSKKAAYIKARASKVKVDGFRPGKAPAHVLEQRLGDEALNSVLRTSIDTAIKTSAKDHELRYIGEPKVDFEDFSEGKDLSFKITFEVMPNIEVKPFDKIELEKLLVEVSDKEVDDSIKDLHKNHKSFKPEDNAKAEKGCRIQIDLTLLDAGKKVPNYTNVETTVDLGDESFMLSGFDKALTGATESEEKTFRSEIASNFHDKALAGKSLDAVVKVKKVLKPVTHKIDDAFAKEFGHDSLDALKQTMRDNLTRNYESIARLYMKRHMLDKLETEYDFDLPESMVNNEFNNIWQHLQNEIAAAKASGEFDEKDAKPEEELKAEYTSIAKRRVKLGLVISEVAKKEKIQLSQDELRNAIYREAMKYTGQERQAMEYFRNNPQAIDAVAAPILEDKVVDHIATKVKTKETKVDVPTLKKKVKGVVPTLFDDEDDKAA